MNAAKGIAVHRGFLIFDETISGLEMNYKRAVECSVSPCSFSMISLSKWITFSGAACVFVVMMITGGKTAKFTRKILRFIVFDCEDHHYKNACCPMWWAPRIKVVMSPKSQINKS